MKKISLAQTTFSLIMIVALTITTFIISPGDALAQVPSCQTEACTALTNQIESECNSEACAELIKAIKFEDNEDLENAKGFYGRSADKVLANGRQQFEVLLAAKQHLADLNGDENDKELVKALDNLLFRPNCPTCGGCGDPPCQSPPRETTGSAISPCAQRCNPG